MRYSRQNKILELIANNEIETQDKLAAMLKAEGVRSDPGDHFQRYQGTAADQGIIFYWQIQICRQRQAGCP